MHYRALPQAHSTQIWKILLSLGRFLIIHLAQQYQSVGNLPLWIQNSRVPDLCILVYAWRQCWQCKVPVSKPWLYKERIRRKASFFSLFWAIHLSQEEGWFFSVLFNTKLCKDSNKNDSAHQCGNENWLRLSWCPTSCVTPGAGDILFGGGSASSALSALIGRGDASGM